MGEHQPRTSKWEQTRSYAPHVTPRRTGRSRGDSIRTCDVRANLILQCVRVCPKTLVTQVTLDRDAGHGHSRANGTKRYAKGTARGNELLRPPRRMMSGSAETPDLPSRKFG